MVHTHRVITMHLHRHISVTISLPPAIEGHDFPRIFRRHRYSQSFPGKNWEISGKRPGHLREMSRKYPGHILQISGNFPGNVCESSGKIQNKSGKFPTTPRESEPAQAHRRHVQVCRRRGPHPTWPTLQSSPTSAPRCRRLQASSAKCR